MFPQNPGEKNFAPQSPKKQKKYFSLSPNPREVKRVGDWKAYLRGEEIVNERNCEQKCQCGLLERPQDNGTEDNEVVNGPKENKGILKF